MKVKSVKRGKPTSAVEVVNVSQRGFWLLIDETEHFLPFDQFPWFRNATIGQLINVELPSPHHLHWPELDIDLAVESLTDPDRYPLVSSVFSSVAANKKKSRNNKSTRSRP